MTDYTNPTGTFNATEGDDKFVFTSFPAFPGTYIDALGGNDRLIVQIDYDLPMFFDVVDWNGGSSFRASASSPYATAASVYGVENVDFRGTSHDDTFNLKLVTTTLANAVTMDGSAGADLLNFDWSKLTTGVSFVVNSSAITSTYGSFSNFEIFEIHAGSGNDTITTGSGRDNIYTGAGVDTVNAGAGIDFVYTEATSGTFDGGADLDFFQGNFGTAASLTVAFGDTITLSNGTLIKNFKSATVRTGAGNDQFTVSKEQTSGGVYGGDGVDTLNYAATSAAGMLVDITSYNGTDLSGAIGTQPNVFQFGEFENVSVAGSQFNDRFQISGNYSGSGLNLNAGGGVDWLQFDLRQSTVGTSLTVGGTGAVTSNRGTFSNFESFSLSGGSGADTFVTGSAADGLTGGRGADYLDGGAGDDGINGADSTFEDDGAADTLIGGLGNDIIGAGYGDTVSGGSGTDELYFIGLSATAGITANFATLTGGGTISVGGATLSGIETIGGIYGSNFGDTLVIGKLTTTHDVQIFGWAGDDRITGSSGADTIHGGTGNDWLTGGLGKDFLIDSEGNDTFADTAAGLSGDIISSFYVGDKIIITDANLSTFSFNVSSGTLTYTGGSLNFGSQLAGPLVATAAAGGGVQLAIRQPPPGTADAIAHQLVSGYWDGATRHFDVSQGGSISVNISGLDAIEQNLARVALSEWSDIIGLSFQEVSTGGQILFDHSEVSGGPVAETQTIFSDGVISTSIVHISSSWITENGTGLNSYSFQAYVHEIGHALGLGRPGDYNVDANYFADALFSNDSWATSVLSYFDQRENKYFDDQGFSREYAMTPMQADILAMQALYGLAGNTRSGDTIYGFGSTAGRDVFNANLVWEGAYTIFDTGGVDTLNYSGFGMNLVINLNPESFSNVGYSSGNVSIARGTVIENAIGGEGSDTLIGNSSDNILTGNGGRDVLAGGAGHDTFRDTIWLVRRHDHRLQHW